MEIHEFLSRFKGVQKSGNGWVALCPAHDDHKPSLSIGVSQDGSKILINCFCGCRDEDILSAVGLKMSDLFTRQDRQTSGEQRKTSCRYCDTDGMLLYTKTRVDYADGTKRFYFLQPNGTKGVQGVKRVPYNLPAVSKAATIYFVEGEKCADAVIQRGRVATTLDSGANSKWFLDYNQHFEGKQVIIIPDNDKPGIEYARKIAQNIPHAVVKQLPGLGEKQDIFDWLAAGYTMDEVDDLPETKLPADEPKGGKSSREGSTQAEILLELCKESKMKLFFNENNDCYAAIPIAGHTEVMPMEGKDFSSYLQKLYYDKTHYPIRKESLTQVIDTLSSIAKFGNKECIKLYNRVGIDGDAFYYDLSNPTWKAVKITVDGWTVEDNPPILFTRYRHQKEQVMPQKGGSISKIFDYINVKEFRTLFLCWLVSCFVPEIPHPMPIVYGEKGAAKSTACVLLKKLIDPSALDTLTLHNDQRTLVVNLQQHYFLPFDNVSHISGETSDTLCRAITGGSVQQRRLCTNADDCIFVFRRCIAINGINNVANRSDLLDRSILLELERVPETERKELSEVYRAFEADRPAILGGIFDTLSKARALYPAVKLDKLPRMADFARWGYAIGEALGGYGEQFLQEYRRNYAIQNTEAIAADSVATLVIAFMRNRRQWEGLVSELLTQLVNMAEDNGISKNAKSLPTMPNALSRRLNGMKSNLEAVGIRFKKKEISGGAQITLCNENISPLPPYQVDSGAILGLSHDDNNGGISAPGQLPPCADPLSGPTNGDNGTNGDDLEDSEDPTVEF